MWPQIRVRRPEVPRRADSRCRKPARGCDVGNGLRQFTVAFDVDTTAEIHALALRSNRASTETIRQLVEWGLESIKDAKQQ